MAKKPGEEYGKGLNDSAKIGEVIQLIERGVAPTRAGAKFAVCVALVAFVVACFALGMEVLR